MHALQRIRKRSNKKYMNIIPQTFQSWVELCAIICITHMLLIHAARNYGNRMVCGALAYVAGVALIYATSLHMLTPLIPYATLLLVLKLLIPSSAALTRIKKSAQQLSTVPDAQPWLTSCLKTVFNHPHEKRIITILIGSKDALADSIHNDAPLNMPWNQTLFTSVLYDPHISHGMLWFSSTGSLLGINVQWANQETDNSSDALHKAHTKEYAALVCMIDQLNRNCTIIDHGIVQPPKNITETVQYITLRTAHTEHLKEGTYHGARHERQNRHNHTP